MSSENEENRFNKFGSLTGRGEKEQLLDHNLTTDMSSHSTLYPETMHRAFVVQLTAECDPPNTLGGRVEHIHSGRAIHFESVSQLLSFLASSMLSERQAEQEERRASDPRQFGSLLSRAR